ncbi:MAG: GNAT family N-acetyltransferase [Bacteroidaceae bacterium]|nr:GNAT family N-acetyltransferase [Bacteroidaceae bacterium]
MTQQDILAQYRIYKLGENELVKSFDCGDADLNDFIINEAPLYRNEKLAVTYVFINKDDNCDIAGFFCLANDRISMADFDTKTHYNRFSKRFANPKRLKSYPAVKIGRLGVSSQLKGKSIGSLLLYFIKNYFIINNKTGCRFITVDAYSNAVPFYLKNGFVPLNDDADDSTRLLYYDLKDLDSIQ